MPETDLRVGFTRGQVSVPVEQVRRQQRHERILDAALRVFSDKGYHRAVVDEIAAASETSKGGVYFHFPTKQAIFLALLDRMAALLRSRLEAAVADEPDAIARADVALQVVLQTFASHRTLARLFFVEALGAGPEFSRRMAQIRSSFARLIQRHLDDAVRQGSIAALDTGVASRVWFGALEAVVTSWVLAEAPGRLEESYPTLRALLLRSIGAQVPPPAAATPSAPPPDGLDAARVSAPPATLAPGRGEVKRLRSVLEEATRRARSRGRAVVASTSLPIRPRDPVAYFEAAAAAPERLLWSRPRTGFALAGAGAAWAVEATGARRFRAVAEAWRDLLEEAVVEVPPDTMGVGPLLVGGFAFDPLRPRTDAWRGFPDARLILPRALLTQVDATTWLTLTTLVPGDAEPEALLSEMLAPIPALLEGGNPAPTGEAGAESTTSAEVVLSEWARLVGEVAALARRGEVEKVVLARTHHLERPGGFARGAALRFLQAEYPRCFVFAVERAGICFLGASPERLVRLRDGIATTMCLAGSIARGSTERDDRELGEKLLASAKDRAEHEVVVRALRAALGDVCEGVAPIGTPVLLKLRNVQHLLTTVVGRVAEGRDIVDIVERLHPTPAVGGYPPDSALELIRRREGLDRGWYAGPIGWLDAHGEGEFAVAIRSALVDGERATLYAGCGIVAESDPEAELQESALKLRPMLAALGAGAI